MSKARLEALSDGVFAIVMTLLIIEIHVPVLEHPSASELWQAIIHILPLLAAYVVAFTVVSMYWTSHHALYHFFTKNINRQLVQLNSLYLMLLCLIPFTTYLLGSYPHNVTAITIFGLNIMAIGLVAFGIFLYALRSGEIELHDVESKTVTQAKIRTLLTPSFAALAVLTGLLGFHWIPFILFMFPVIFNTIPGSLNATERFLGITIK